MPKILKTDPRMFPFKKLPWGKTKPKIKKTTKNFKIINLFTDNSRPSSIVNFYFYNLVIAH
jgi:hypothetical protein